MQEVQPSLDKSIHLFWSGEGNPKSVLPGAKHLDPLLQMAQRHQPAHPNKGFLGMWSVLGDSHVVVILRISRLQLWARLLGIADGKGCLGWVLLQCQKPSPVWSSILLYPPCVQQTSSARGGPSMFLELLNKSFGSGGYK